jgi:HEAT repeats/PBS lyase HEAT-like repeat
MPHRHLRILGLVLLLTAAAESPAAPKCTCREGEACYHFLNAPVKPPDDACHCAACRTNRGSCPRRIPDRWDAACANNTRMACFLRRHAASWGLTCSVMLDEPKCACKNPHPEWCPKCGENGSDWRDHTALKTIRRQRELEAKVFGRKPKLIVVTSRHFYLVTDISNLKVRTQNGTPRRMGTHELAHLYAQRAEIAHEDFCRVFGRLVDRETRIAIYLTRRESTQDVIARTYFGLPVLDFTYGASETRDVAGGYCRDGLAISFDQHSSDHWLHLKLRHNIGHILVSRWRPPGGRYDVLPVWVYRGSAHWLSRLPRKFHEMATFHHGEGKVEIDTGAKWQKHLRRMASSPSTSPMQRFLDMAHRESLSLDDHRRIWSWFDLFLAEDRERFLAFLCGMLGGREGRASLEAAFGCSPEELDQRLKDRVLGKRRSLAPTAEELDAAQPDSPGARRRASLRSETDRATLAAKIRALEAVREPLTAESLLPHLAHESELVRESAVLMLTRGSSPDVVRWLREEGLEIGPEAVRAQIIRILGGIPDQDAGPALMPHLGSAHWHTRAQSARAMGRIRHEPALRTLAKLTADSSPMVRIASLVALGRFGPRAGFSLKAAAAQLSASTWQVRSAAAECLGALGDLRAVDPLLDRMEKEGGRIRLDIRDALRLLIGDDLGADPRAWRNWWDKEKERHGGIPPPEAMGKPTRPEDEDYAPPPTFYGLRVFSSRVAYLVDSSGSMLREMTIDPKWLRKNRREYPPRAARFVLASCEVERSLRSLDSRSGFTLMFFSDRAEAVKDGLTTATPQNVNRALSRMRAAKPGTFSGRQSVTNYVDALRLLLDRKKDEGPTDRLRNTADTAYFLTDGYPTAGDITEPDVLLSWFLELNDFARIRLHVLTYGKVGSDHRMLAALAEGNGGTFVMVPEAR